MSKFITLDSIHQNNIEGDTIVSLYADDILMLVDATVLDKKHRATTKTIVSLRNGQCLGVAQSRDEILQLISELTLS